MIRTITRRPEGTVASDRSPTPTRETEEEYNQRIAKERAERYMAKLRAGELSPKKSKPSSSSKEEVKEEVDDEYAAADRRYQEKLDQANADVTTEVDRRAKQRPHYRQSSRAFSSATEDDNS